MAMRVRLLAPLSGKVLAQTLLGMWGYNEVQVDGVPAKRLRFLARTEPRHYQTRWDRFMAMGYLGYALSPAHTFLLGAVSAHFYYPVRFYQERLQQRWQVRLARPLVGTLTLEERWQNYVYAETRLRLSARYEKPWWKLRLLLLLEVHLQDKGRLFQGAITLRENRLGLFLGLRSAEKWNFELGYLNVSFPHQPPGHRLWIATRLYISEGELLP